MAQAGFPGKITALIIDVRHKKVSQAMEPALEKLARHWRIDPAKTIEMIQAKAAELDPMTEQELEARRLMQVNRMDRSQVFPR